MVIPGGAQGEKGAGSLPSKGTLTSSSPQTPCPQVSAPACKREEVYLEPCTVPTPAAQLCEASSSAKPPDQRQSAQNPSHPHPSRYTAPSRALGTTWEHPVLPINT